MSPRVPAPRAALHDIPVYVPRPPRQAAVGPHYRLFMNENPYPPLPSVRQRIAEAAERTQLYPGVFPERLVDALARELEVPHAHVVTGPGSVGIYQQIGQAMLSPGDEVIYARPSFEAFPITVRTAGAVPIEVPLVAGTHDLETMAAAVTPRTKAIFVCEPNNPTGTAVGVGRLKWFLDRVPEDVLVVLDEAYHEFFRSPDAPDGVALYRDHPNVLVLRTFSKAYGLAGLRVGYGVTHPPIADALRKCAIPCGIGNIAEEAALASLAAKNELLQRVKHIAEERDRLRDALLAHGFDVPVSHANFLWLPLRDEADAFAARWEERGLLTRCFPGQGVRITVGDRAVNDLLITTAAQG
ncbi:MULTISPECIES: histidinol-phosphate transaminase [unclassified Streptomyces]|uniref:histidinol-phosphate transaminase n=1 Tax=unclassified Streptomyces TaxID=2593676 RepID=UPI0004762CFE|nr:MULTISPECIES: histidinol-phosphate transaminase [unclassified Streptomyces]MYT33083.1 aminotransferase class I/II-fold pyridoxal phosphate-dependent enzyme [Streptomyces sp. SID8354]